MKYPRSSRSTVRESPRRSASRAWLQAARKQRPETLTTARAKINKIYGMIPWETEGAALVRLRRELRKLQAMITKGESRYVDLYAALDKGDRLSAGRTLADVRARERAIDTEWQRIWSEIVARIDDVAFASGKAVVFSPTESNDESEQKESTSMTSVTRGKKD